VPERTAPVEVALVARVRPHDEAEYLRYVAGTYAPALAAMPGFRSLRVLRWHLSADPAATPRGDVVEFLRISTWASRAAADAYYASPVRATFGRLLELADVLAYGEAEVVVSVDGDATAGEDA
jgi:heme-degrading monooxygenase HmoA